MNGPDFPAPLLRLLETAIPTFAAAELLLFLARTPEPRTPEEIVEAIRPTLLALPAAEEYLALFKAQGLVAERAGRAFVFAPADDTLASAVNALAQAYNERPVTLIRTISRFADHKLQVFADSFKLKRR